ncbi:hypothetical protein NQ176_g1126 [Zarea fungicola]|uniref:Uncharacterized protein n=1 Tax=Zarea fungicola TaxID=93591 RepID=A0ACC1NVM2_9HYPO|nr:hypothetical protein NQ176_g1126 [Lecanicillium fungicola]
MDGDANVLDIGADDDPRFLHLFCGLELAHDLAENADARVPPLRKGKDLAIAVLLDVLDKVLRLVAGCVCDGHATSDAGRRQNVEAMGLGESIEPMVELQRSCGCIVDLPRSRTRAKQAASSPRRNLALYFTLNWPSFFPKASEL